MAGRADRPGEFALIDRYFRPLATDPAALDLRDDAALLACDPAYELVLTVDAIAEGVHFLPEDPPDAIAAKALRVNLSDLAAKGAEPHLYLLSLGLPSDWTEAWVASFAAGLARDQATFGIALAGGDTVLSPGGISVSVTAIGRLPKGTMVHRAGAEPSDIVFVSGTIGDAALGLKIRQGVIDPADAGEGADYLHRRLIYPEPRTRLAAAVRAHASASMDVSDGLVGDLGQVCRASGVGAIIDAAAVPLSMPARLIVEREPDHLATAITGGEDFEILTAVPVREADAYRAAAARVGVSVTAIGRIVEGDDVTVLDAAGRPMELAFRSYVHFAKG